MEDASENLTVEVPVTETGPDAPTTAATTDSPRRYAGEFDTVEELEAKYQELLKTTTTAAPSGEPGDGEGGDPNSNDPDGSPTDDKETESASASRDDAEKALSGKGLDIAEFEREFDATGGLSEESYAKLEQAGLGKDVVDSYIAGRTALLNSFISDVKGLAGGRGRLQGHHRMGGQGRPHGRRKGVVQPGHELRGQGAHQTRRIRPRRQVPGRGRSGPRAGHGEGKLCPPRTVRHVRFHGTGHRRHEGPPLW